MPNEKIVGRDLCPKCLSENIETFDEDSDWHSVDEFMQCDACGAKWRATYEAQFTGWSKIKGDDSPW